MVVTSHNSYFTSNIQESKEQNADLNCQMEALKLEMKGDGHLRKGNSLFGEVDDRRMEIERKMISLKVHYETLEKTHATTQHQLRKMKVPTSHVCVHIMYIHVCMT